MSSPALSYLSSPRSYPARAIASLALIVGLVLISVSKLLVLGDEAHFMNFADKRAMLGVDNAIDVLTNIGFLVVALLGLRAVAQSPAADDGDKARRLTGFITFAAVLATAFGSTWFHLNPTHETLLWDRLPMAIGFSSLVCLLIVDRISARAGLWMLGGLTTFALWSIYQWQYLNFATPYTALQVGSILAVLLMAWLHSKGRIANRYIWLTALGYVIAKVFEALDRPLFELTGFISGHSLKHIMAALALYALVAGFRALDKGVKS